MSFEEAEPNCQSTGWRYTIKPSTLGYHCPGNLLFLIRRAKDDTRVVNNGRMPKPVIEEMPV